MDKNFNIHIYELIECTNTNPEIYDKMYTYFIVVGKNDGTARFKHVIMPNTIDFEWKTTEASFSKDAKGVLTVSTKNSKYVFEPVCMANFNTFMHISDYYTTTRGGEPDYFGNPSDKGVVYCFPNNLELEVRYLSHCIDNDGNIGYFPFPDNLWIIKDGKNIYSIDSPYADFYKIFEDAINGGFELIKDHISEYNESIYEYATDSYL